jgi:hypothetical protein
LSCSRSTSTSWTASPEIVLPSFLASFSFTAASRHFVWRGPHYCRQSLSPFYCRRKFCGVVNHERRVFERLPPWFHEFALGRCKFIWSISLAFFDTWIMIQSASNEKNIDIHLFAYTLQYSVENIVKTLTNLPVAFRLVNPPPPPTPHTNTHRVNNRNELRP